MPVTTTAYKTTTSSPPQGTNLTVAIPEPSHNALFSGNEIMSAFTSSGSVTKTTV